MAQEELMEKEALLLTCEELFLKWITLHKRDFNNQKGLQNILVKINIIYPITLVSEYD